VEGSGSQSAAPPKPVISVALLPGLAGLAVWESSWRTPHARGSSVALVAIVFIVFSFSTAFGGGGASS
jgi:hypothetical protein